MQHRRRTAASIHAFSQRRRRGAVTATLKAESATDNSAGRQLCLSAPGARSGRAVSRHPRERQAPLGGAKLEGAADDRGRQPLRRASAMSGISPDRADPVPTTLSRSCTRTLSSRLSGSHWHHRRQRQVSLSRAPGRPRPRSRRTVVAVKEEAFPDLEDAARAVGADLHWVSLGQLGKCIKMLKAAGDLPARSWPVRSSTSRSSQASSPT